MSPSVRVRSHTHTHRHTFCLHVTLSCRGELRWCCSSGLKADSGGWKIIMVFCFFLLKCLTGWVFFGRLVASHGNIANKQKTLRGYFYCDVKNSTIYFSFFLIPPLFWTWFQFPLKKKVNKQIEIVTFLFTVTESENFCQASKSGFKSFHKSYKAEDDRSFRNATFSCLCCFILCTRRLEVTLLSYAEHALQIATVLPKCSFKRHSVGFKQDCF